MGRGAGGLLKASTFSVEEIVPSPRENSRVTMGRILAQGLGRAAGAPGCHSALPL